MLLGTFLLALISFGVYYPACRGGFFWDDNHYIIENDTLRSLQGIKRIWLDPQSNPQYYPAVFSSFWLEYHVWALNPTGYHITNIALHAINSILFWLVLRRLAAPGAWLAAAIFAVHPVHVESVAWISERKDVLAGTWYFLALLFWLEFITKRRRTYYLAALVAFASALLSKTTVCTLPLALVLLQRFRQQPIWKRETLLLAPFVVLGGTLGVLTFWLEHDSPYSYSGDDLAGIARLLIPVRALWFYIYKLVWPVPLMTIYPRWSINPAAPLEYVFLGGGMLLVLTLWYYRFRLGVAPLIALAYFAITLSPALGAVPFDFMRLSFVSDHFQYLASCSLIALLAGTVWILAERAPIRPRVVQGVLVVGCLAVLAPLTWRQCKLYESSELLWRHTLRYNPLAAEAHNQLGGILARRGNLAEAATHLRKALEIEPGHPEANALLGSVLLDQNRSEDAIAHLTVAVRARPNISWAQYNLAVLLMKKGLFDDAEQHLEQATHSYPGYVSAHFKLAMLHLSRGESEKAIRDLTAVIRLRPRFPPAYHYLGMAFLQQGDLLQAASEFEEALRINPVLAETHFRLGTALEALGRSDAAATQYRAVLRINPAHSSARRRLKAALGMVPPERREPR